MKITIKDILLNQMLNIFKAFKIFTMKSSAFTRKNEI